MLSKTVSSGIAFGYCGASDLPPWVEPVLKLGFAGPPGQPLSIAEA